MNNIPNIAVDLWGRVAASEKRIAEKKRCYLELREAGAQASIETRDQLLEQNKVLKLQLSEQTKINQRLEREFKMGAREAVITRKIAYWSLGVGIAGIICSVISFFRG